MEKGIAIFRRTEDPLIIRSKRVWRAKLELHHFSGASVHGYGQCSYLRLVNNSNQVQCSFATGKSRITPRKNVTVPRLGLTAALVSKVSSVLQHELDYEKVTEMFWTDSQVVLGYIRNDARCFHVFEANRVQQIRDSSSPSQWQYVRTRKPSLRSFPEECVLEI